MSLTKVEVPGTRIWAAWCREHCKKYWRLKLGRKNDSYYFADEQEAKVFQEEAKQYYEWREKALKGNNNL